MICERKAACGGRGVSRGVVSILSDLVKSRRASKGCEFDDAVVAGLNGPASKESGYRDLSRVEVVPRPCLTSPGTLDVKEAQQPGRIDGPFKEHPRHYAAVHRV